MAIVSFSSGVLKSCILVAVSSLLLSASRKMVGFSSPVEFLMLGFGSVVVVTETILNAATDDR